MRPEQACQCRWQWALRGGGHAPGAPLPRPPALPTHAQTHVQLAARSPWDPPAEVLGHLLAGPRMGSEPRPGLLLGEGPAQDPQVALAGQRPVPRSQARPHSSSCHWCLGAGQLQLISTRQACSRQLLRAQHCAQRPGKTRGPRHLYDNAFLQPNTAPQIKDSANSLPVG